MVQWMHRAGIMVVNPASNGMFYIPDQRRLSMALDIAQDPPAQPAVAAPEPADEQVVDGNMESADAPAWKAAKQQGESVETFDWELTPDEVRRVYQNALAGKFSCKHCLASIDAVGLCATCKALEKPRECLSCHKPLDPRRDKFDLYGRCADCGFIEAGGTIPLRALEIDPEKIEDRSGERIVDDLRRFIAGPCGRPK
jgi:hypothetical protein